MVEGADDPHPVSLYGSQGCDVTLEGFPVKLGEPIERDPAEHVADSQPGVVGPINLFSGKREVVAAHALSAQDLHGRRRNVRILPEAAHDR
jgi:hypothetical protein